jgi:hypothetical protein
MEEEQTTQWPKDRQPDNQRTPLVDVVYPNGRDWII